MPLKKYEFSPGINKQVTEYGAETLWIDSENVRFRYGQAEKIGGWEELISSKIIGAVRNVHAWTSLEGIRHLSLGTDRKLYVYSDGAVYDVTPIRNPDGDNNTTNSVNLTNPFVTSSGSAVVTVTDASHGAIAGDFVTFSNSAAVGGLDMDQEFEITSVTDADTYTVTHSSNASSTATGGGSTTVDCAYQISIGEETSTYGYGWGTGLFGGLTLNPTTDQLNEALDSSETAIDVDDGSTFSVGNYILVEQETMKITAISSNTLTVTRGIEDPDDDTVATSGDSHAATTHADNTTVYLDAAFVDWGAATTSSSLTLGSRYWSFDNFGEDLLALASDSKLYRWNTSAGTGTRAAVIANAPTASRFLLVSSDRFVFLFGTETTIATTATQDDLFFRFSKQEEYGTWAPGATNNAGAFRIQDGSKIVTAVRSRGGCLVWTDTSLHSVQHLGPPYTFGLTQVGSNCGAVSPSCAVDINGKTYWMSQQAFYVFDGGPKKMPCSVQDYVFDDFNQTQEPLVYAGTNTDFNEITWFYASKDSSYIDRNVTYNYLENIWYTNSLARTTWLDRGVYDLPYATEYSPTVNGDTPTVLGVTDGSSIIYVHEKGDDDVVAALPCFLQSGDFDIEDGEQMLSIKRMLPDFKDQKGSANILLSLKDFPATTSTNTLNGAITGTTSSAATGGGSTVILTSSSNFPSSGTILVGTELISYTSNTTATGALGGLTRGVNSTTAATHIDNKKVSNYTNVRINSSTITPLITKSDTRGRGRQANLLISSDSVGDKWRFGTLRLDIRPDGGR